MATKKEYEMLFALEAQLGREFRATFQKARDEFKDTAVGAESFGDKATEAVDVLSSALAAAGMSAALGKLKDLFDECTQASMDFESAMTGVAKTTDLSDAELARMTDSIRDMSTEIPASTEEIAAVAEAAGQLGIQKDALLDFTETMTMLGTATNMTAEDAATALARFANITGMSADNYDRLGSVIVDLGNHFATSESEITQMGTRLASAGKLAGLTEPQIMALSAAMSSVGIEAEAGGTAMTQTLNAIEKAVATSSDELTLFAEVAGMSADEFANVWGTDAMSALTTFISGLGELEAHGGNTVTMLEDLGLTGIRQSNMLKSLAQASGMMDDAVSTANTAWSQNVALSAEASKRYATTQSKMDMMQNSVNNLRAAIGDAFTPVLGDLYDIGNDVLKDVTDFVQDHPALVKAIGATAGALGAVGAAMTTIAAARKIFSALDLATMLAGPAGIALKLAGAISGVVAGIALLADASANDGTPSLRELTEAARDLNAAMADAKETCTDTVAETEAAANVASRYVSRLEDLNAAGEMNEQQQSEYHGTLIMLTQTIPELAELINLETDEINGGTAALYANIEAWRQRATAQAYQEQLNQIYKKNSEVVLHAAIAEVRLSDAKEELTAAEQAQQDELDRQGALWETATKQMQEYYEQTGVVCEATAFLGESSDEMQWKLEQAQQRVEDAQHSIKTFENAIKDDNEALEAAKTEIEAAERAVKNLTGAMEDGAGAAGDAARGQEELSAAFGSTKEQIDTITQAYQEAFEAARSSVESQYSLWSDVDQIVETTAGTINDNLTKQIDHWQSYNDSLAKLRERSDDIEGLADIIGSFADGSAESVNAVAGMAVANDDDLKKMVENWQSLKKSQQEAEESIAEYRSSFGEQMDALQSDLEDDIAAMDLGSEAKENGRATIQGFIDGAAGMLPLVQQAYSQLGSAALAALNRNGYYNSASPNRRMSGISRYATGTDYADTGLALVGEEGPELVMMQGGETVLNAHATEAALSGTSGTEINSPLVEINIEGNADQNVIDQLNLYSEELAERVISIMRDFQTDRKRTAYA